MTINIVVGNVVVTSNADALTDPVEPQPTTEADTFAAFVEDIVVSDLAGIVFNAFPDVVDMAIPGSAPVTWPPGFGSNTRPFGNPGDPVTGVRERLVIDDPGATPPITRWTDTVNGQAPARKSFYDTFGGDAIAIATGIKAAIEANFKSNRVTLVAGAATISNENFTANSEILVTRRTAGGTIGLYDLLNITPGSPGSFEIISTSLTDTSVVSYLIAGG